MSRIEKLDWDSSHFQLKVGKFSASKTADLQAFERLDKSAFDVIYIFCLPGFSEQEKVWFEKKELRLMDRKQVFAMDIPPEAASDEEPCIQSVDSLSESVLDLAFQSGVYSRFHVDKQFSPNIFKMLYSTWITRSVNREIAKEVFGYFENGKLLGFITYGHKNGSGDIGLLAVADGQRGKGIGKKLVKKVMEATRSDGFSSLQVATQGLNTNAISFYKNCGFEVAEELDIYHYWTSLAT